MGLCEKVITKRVICEDIFYVDDDERDVHIGEIAVPKGSTISGEVDITVTECKPIISACTDPLKALLQFFVQKELVVTTPTQKQYPLEFGFRLAREVEFPTCFPQNLKWIRPDQLKNIECYIVELSAKDKVTLHPSHPAHAKNATFDEQLIIKARIKVVYEGPLLVAKCPRDSHLQLRL